MLFSREYLLLTAALLMYSLFLIRSRVLFGTGHTAPFSMWTFADYVSSTMVLALILLAALCSKLFTDSEVRASALVRSTPTPYALYRGLRLTAATLLYLVSVSFSVLVCYLYYAWVFSQTDLWPLIQVWAMIAIPSSLFILGAAVLAGSYSMGLAQVLLASLVALEVFKVPLPEVLDLRGATVLAALQASDQPFAVSTTFLLGRCLIGLAGLVLLGMAFGKSDLRST